MKILLFGGSGQLGCEIVRRANDLNFEIQYPVISEVNITELEQMTFLASRVKPEVIINCAAYTAVDQAETEEAECRLINTTGAGNVALAAKEVGARLIHLSTDYVFDGSKNSLLTESDPVGPINVYGRTKLEGEQEVLRILGDRALVIRTSSLHGKGGVNFVHTMVRLFTERETVSVIQDQTMCATWAGWLAEGLLDLCRIPCSGVLHACCTGPISWYDFASEIHALVGGQLVGMKTTEIKPVLSAEFVRPARRPAYSAMSTARLTELLGRPAITWRDGLRAHLTELGYTS